jgi:hypothetical protein
MVIVRLMGGLGNQMFQYAAARATSLRTGEPVKLDLTWFADEGSRVSPRRGYELDAFGLELEVASEGELARTLRRRIVRRRPRIIEDGSLRFDPRVLHARDVRLIGYWQSERYFADQADTIRRDFELPPADPELERRIGAVESVSLHVRRGDYASSAKVEAELGVLPLDYYAAAIARMREELGSPEFFVFSNDAAWTEANLAIDAPHTFVRHPPGARAHHDLRLMSLCRHHVVANSSFSWWGAWLREGPDTLVVAPERWFLTPRYDTSDVVPERWLRI